MGGGTRYTLSLDFADAVQMLAGVSAASTALIDPERMEAPGSGGGGQGGGGGSGGGGQGGQPDEFRLPDDFTGSASASSSFSYMQVVMARWTSPAFHSGYISARSPKSTSSTI